VGLKNCICCGGVWGDGVENTESSGLCPKCFASWVNGKKRFKGHKECYGEFEMHIDVDCKICSVITLCSKDTYGI